MRLAPRTGKMNEIIAVIGYSSEQDGEFFIDQVAWSRWLDIGLVLFSSEFMDLYSVSVHKNTQ